MKKIRYFKCINGYKFERMVTDDILEVKCECGEKAVRLLSAPRYFGSTTGKAVGAVYR